MTRFCTIALSLLLFCQAVHGEGAPHSAPGAPLAVSVAREASRLALEEARTLCPQTGRRCGNLLRASGSS